MAGEEGCVERASREVRGLYEEAYNAGYSVFEIARIACYDDIKYVHKCLRETKTVPAMKRGAPRKISRPVPELIAKELAKLETTFPIWCCLSYFEQEDALMGDLSENGIYSTLSSLTVKEVSFRTWSLHLFPRKGIFDA